MDIAELEHQSFWKIRKSLTDLHVKAVYRNTERLQNFLSELPTNKS